MDLPPALVDEARDVITTLVTMVTVVRVQSRVTIRWRNPESDVIKQGVEVPEFPGFLLTDSKKPGILIVKIQT